MLPHHGVTGGRGRQPRRGRLRPRTGGRRGSPGDGASALHIGAVEIQVNFYYQIKMAVARRGSSTGASLDCWGDARFPALRRPVLIDLVLWPMMAIPALLVGQRLIPVLGLDGAFRKPSDAGFVALWLGLLLIANLLFAAALFVPLPPTLIVLLGVALSLIGLAHRQVRAHTASLFRALSASPPLMVGISGTGCI